MPYALQNPQFAKRKTNKTNLFRTACLFEKGGSDYVKRRAPLVVLYRSLLNG